MVLTNDAQEGLYHLKALLALDTTNPPDPQEPIPNLIHGKNERIVVDAFGWGVEVLLEVVRRFCGHG